MKFKVGDIVVHPVYGPGDIVKIEEKRLSKTETARLYYKIALSRSTIWMPVESQATIGLRLVTAKRDLGRYRKLLKSHPIPLNNDHPQRHVEMAGRLKQGSFQVMCETVRDLTAWGWQNSLGSTDKATLKKARERLEQEWAMADGISTTEAIEEIDSLLQANHQVYNTG